jgi:hypothetical protein
MKERTERQTDEFHILKIDANRLDKEWIAQPQFYFQYASKLADAKQKVEEAKAELDLVRAEAERKIRRKPEKYCPGEKVTEGGVKCALENREEVKQAQQQVLTAKHRVDILQAAVSALDHRKTALENLVRLTLSNYMASPRAPEGTEEQVDHMVKKSIRQQSNRKGK